MRRGAYIFLTLSVLLLQILKFTKSLVMRFASHGLNQFNWFKFVLLLQSILYQPSYNAIQLVQWYSFQIITDQEYRNRNETHAIRSLFKVISTLLAGKLITTHKLLEFIKCQYYANTITHTYTCTFVHHSPKVCNNYFNHCNLDKHLVPNYYTQST